MSGTFELMMARIRSQNPQRVALAIQTLQWLTLSKQNLSAADLKNALAVESGNQDLNTENITDIKFVVQSCLGLVVSDPMTGTVGLFHYSIQEFFQAPERINKYFPLGDVHIAEMCLTFINFQSFSSQVPIESRDPWPDVDGLPMKTVPFLRYAAGFWGHHTQSGINSEVGRLLLHGSLFAPLAISTSESSSTPEYTESLRAFDHCRSVITGTTNEDSRPFFPYNIVHVGAFFGSVPILSFLFKEAPHTRALFDAPDASGHTPLAIAVLNGNLEAARFLLKEASANPNTIDTSGQRILNHAITKRNEPLFKLLLSSPRINLNTPRGHANRAKMSDISTPLTRAAQLGWMPGVRILIGDPRVDINLKDGRTRRTPLGYAAHMGKAEVVEALLALGDRVDPDSKDRMEQTSLCNAVISGHVDVVKLLLDTNRVVVDPIDEDGLTPLVYAANRGHIKIVELLLRANAEPNIRDGSGRSMLVYAIDVMDDHWDIVHLLLESRGGQLEVDCKDTTGKTPLSYAVEREVEWWVGTLGEECFDGK